MKYFSTFSGIGGFELAITQVYDYRLDLQKQKTKNIQKNSTNTSCGKMQRPTCIGYSEIDKYAVQVYKKQFPKHKNYGDITKIKANELPDFDLLVGGFPCQAFSIAGKRKGFNDTRGTLFFDLARILKEKQPRYFIFENVKGLLSHDSGNTFKTIISTIDELGYDCQWQVLNSKNFGVPQNRERVFIVGHLRGTSRPEVFPITGSNQKTLNQLIAGGQGNRVYDPKGISTTIASQAGGQGAKTGLYAVPVLTPDRLNKRQNGRRFKENGEPSFTLTGQDRHGVMIKEATKKGYAEATEGDSINLSVPNSKTRRGRVGKGLANTLDTSCSQGTIANTLDANYAKGNSSSKKRHTPRTQILQDSKIRRLTPKECERLQGFPDDWTSKGILDGKEVDISDTQRYKMAGNAVTVNVVKAIISRLINN